MVSFEEGDSMNCNANLVIIIVGSKKRNFG